MWVRRLLTIGIVLCSALYGAPAAAAAPCTGSGCYRYYADITIVAWTNPSGIPVFPGSTHTYTAAVTNTGWRVGGNTGPVPGIGPASSNVFVVFLPNAPGEYPVPPSSSSGVPFSCGAYMGGLACEALSIPSGTTATITVTFRTTMSVGAYVCSVYADTPTWTEYNESNNSTVVPYLVGYLA